MVGTSNLGSWNYHDPWKATYFWVASGDEPPTQKPQFGTMQQGAADVQLGFWWLGEDVEE